MMNKGIAHIYTMLVHVISTDKYVYEKTENSVNSMSLPSFCLTHGSVSDNIIRTFAAFNISVLIDNYRVVSTFHNIPSNMSLQSQIYQTLIVDLSKYNELSDFEENHGFGFKLCNWNELLSMKDKLIQSEPVIQLNSWDDLFNTKHNLIKSEPVTQLNKLFDIESTRRIKDGLSS